MEHAFGFLFTEKGAEFGNGVFGDFFSSFGREFFAGAAGVGAVVVDGEEF